MTATHPWMGQVDAVLVAPDLTETTIFSRTSAGNAVAPGSHSNLNGHLPVLRRRSDCYIVVGAPRPLRPLPTSLRGLSLVGAGRRNPTGGTPTLLTPAFSALADPNGLWVLRVRDSTPERYRLDRRCVTPARCRRRRHRARRAVPARDRSVLGLAARRRRRSGGAPKSARWSPRRERRLHRPCPSGRHRSDLSGAGITLPGPAGLRDHHQRDRLRHFGQRLGLRDDDAHLPEGLHRADDTRADRDEPSVPGRRRFTGRSGHHGGREFRQRRHGGPLRVGRLQRHALRLRHGGSPGEPCLGIPIDVDDDSITVLRAVATDPAGNASACSDAVVYVEDSTALAPTLTGTSPVSPSNDPLPKVQGVAEVGSTVDLYVTSGCTGTIASTGLPHSSRDQESRSRPRATAQRSSRRGSPTRPPMSRCVRPRSRTRTIPWPRRALTLSAMDLLSGSNDNAPRVKGTAEAGAMVRLFGDAVCVVVTRSGQGLPPCWAARALPSPWPTTRRPSCARRRRTPPATPRPARSSIAYAEVTPPPRRGHG